MKLRNIFIGIIVVYFVYLYFWHSREGFKNVDNEAANQLNKITNKILPSKALCIRGAQCISGKCLRNNNESTYGYCQ